MVISIDSVSFTRPQNPPPRSNSPVGADRVEMRLPQYSFISDRFESFTRQPYSPSVVQRSKPIPIPGRDILGTEKDVLNGLNTYGKQKLENLFQTKLAKLIDDNERVWAEIQIENQSTEQGATHPVKFHLLSINYLDRSNLEKIDHRILQPLIQRAIQYANKEQINLLVKPAGPEETEAFKKLRFKPLQSLLNSYVVPPKTNLAPDILSDYWAYEGAPYVPSRPRWQVEDSATFHEVADEEIFELN